MGDSCPVGQETTVFCGTGLSFSLFANARILKLVLSWMKSIHILTLDFFKIRVSNFLPSTLIFAITFTDQNCMCICDQPNACHMPRPSDSPSFNELMKSRNSGRSSLYNFLQTSLFAVTQGKIFSSADSLFSNTLTYVIQLV